MSVRPNRSARVERPEASQLFQGIAGKASYRRDGCPFLRGDETRAVPAARLLTGRVFTDSFLPPLMSLSGHKPNQDANAAALRNRERSGPTSDNKVWAVKALIPGMAVRSTPKIRYRWPPWCRSAPTWAARDRPKDCAR